MPEYHDTKGLQHVHRDALGPRAAGLHLWQLMECCVEEENRLEITICYPFSTTGCHAMYPSVTKVTPAEDYVLSIVFDTGEHGTLDMKPLLDFGVFHRLKDRDAFERVRVAFDTIEWDRGIDLDPEFVYDKCLMDNT
jgi:hypothetical protein